MSHYYKGGVLVPEGTEGALPSVTTILDIRAKPELYAWRERVGPEVANAHQQTRADIGTRVHAACEARIDGDIKWPTDETLPFIRGFENWLLKFDPQQPQPEIYLESELHEFCGTADLVCTIDGELWIVDYKTSSRVSPEYALQLAAYQQAYWEANGERPHRAVLQLTDKTKRGYRWHPYDDNEDGNDLSVFLAHKEIFDWLQSQKRPIGSRADTGITWIV